MCAENKAYKDVQKPARCAHRLTEKPRSATENTAGLAAKSKITSAQQQREKKEWYMRPDSLFTRLNLVRVYPPFGRELQGSPGVLCGQMTGPLQSVCFIHGVHQSNCQIEIWVCESKLDRRTNRGSSGPGLIARKPLPGSGNETRHSYSCTRYTAGQGKSTYNPMSIALYKKPNVKSFNLRSSLKQHYSLGKKH